MVVLLALFVRYKVGQESHKRQGKIDCTYEKCKGGSPMVIKVTSRRKILELLSVGGKS